MVSHAVYGLSIRSNRPIPGLLEAEAADIPDVEVVFDSMPEGIGTVAEAIYWHPTHQSGHSNLKLGILTLRQVQYFWFQYVDGIQFAVNQRGTQVWTIWPDDMRMEDVAVNLLGPVLGFLLRMRGVLCLHASGIAIDGKAVAFAGPQGSGKSTIAAAFAKAGYAVLSDDVLPVTVVGAGEVFAHAAYPRLRLWPDSAAMLFGSPDALPRITPNWNKLYLDLSPEGYRFHSRSSPLAAIYLLDERVKDPGPITIGGVAVRDAFVSLLTNTYANYLLDRNSRVGEFGQLKSLVARVRVRRVGCSSDPLRLPEFIDTILRDIDRSNGRLSMSLEDVG